MKEGKPTFEQEQDAKRAETQQRYDLQMAAELERYRRDAALRLLEKLLETPENRQRLWDRYVMDRSEGKLAVDLANDLVKELGKVK